MLELGFPLVISTQFFFLLLILCVKFLNISNLEEMIFIYFGILFIIDFCVHLYILWDFFEHHPLSAIQ